MPKQLTRSAARIYGALSGLGDNTNDVQEQLVPFFEHLLRAENGNILDPVKFAKAVTDTYRWNFNVDLVESFVPYFQKFGWLTANTHSHQVNSYTITVPSERLSDEDDKQVNEELTEIAKNFKSFSDNLSPLTAINKTVEEYEDMLIEWLIYTEAYSIANLGFTTGFRKSEDGKIINYVDVPNSTSLGDDERYLCARFVRSALIDDENIGTVLVKIASIGLLTEVVQDFVKPTDSVEHSDLVVYLDAPVALELIGVSGQAAMENTQPVIDELIRIGAKVRIYEQSIEEMKTNLSAMLENQTPTGPTAEALRRNEVLKSYVIEASKNPERILIDKGVQVTGRSLEQFPSEEKYFTHDHYKELYNALSFNPNPNARDHDTTIVTFVMRQRGKLRSKDIFKSKYVILTRNGLFSEQTKKITKQLGLINSFDVPPVIHRRFFVTAMWLRTGMGSNDLDVPKRMLLASCERVLAVNLKVVESVKKYAADMEDEIKKKQLEFLVCQERSVQVLMDKTLGGSNILTGDNFHILFDEMLHPFLEEEREKSKLEITKEKKTSKAKIDKIKMKSEIELSKKNKLSDKLIAIHAEDKKIVDGLCAEATTKLKKRVKINKTLCAIIALSTSIPYILDKSLTISMIAAVFGVILAYLTVTGSELLPVKIKQKGAIETLNKLADSRSLLAKLNKFNIDWTDNNFIVQDKSLDFNDVEYKEDLYNNR